MKIALVLLILCCAYPLAAQSDKRFDNFHGLRHTQTGDEYFEGEGYDIFSQLITYKLDQKGMSKLKKRYNVKDIEPTLDSLLQIKVFKTKETRDSVIAHVN